MMWWESSSPQSMSLRQSPTAGSSSRENRFWDQSYFASPQSKQMNQSCQQLPQAVNSCYKLLTAVKFVNSFRKLSTALTSCQELSQAVNIFYKLSTATKSCWQLPQAVNSYHSCWNLNYHRDHHHHAHDNDTCERSRDFSETRGLSHVGTIVDKEFLPRFRYIKLLRLILMIWWWWQLWKRISKFRYIKLLRSIW